MVIESTWRAGPYRSGKNKPHSHTHTRVCYYVVLLFFITGGDQELACTPRVTYDSITHAEGVLYVNEPAVEAVTVADLDQLIGHGAVRLLVFQEGLARCRSICPLCDESPWKASQSQQGWRGEGVVGF